MARLSDLPMKAFSALVGFVALSAGGLAINAGAAVTFKIAAIIAFINDGVFKSKGITAAIPFTAGHKAVPLGGYVCLFVVGLDAAGAVTTYQASRVFLPEVQDDGTTKYRGFDFYLNAAGVPVAAKMPQLEDFNSSFLPDVPHGITPVGIIKITANSANFVPGTSALDLAGTVPAYFDISVLPGATNL